MRTQTQKAYKSGRKTSSKRSAQTIPQHTSPLIQLQKHLGNQTLRRLLQTKRAQAKLTIGKPNDVYEQEADRVADQVMRMPDRDIIRRSDEPSEDNLPNIQHLCPECEAGVQRQAEEEKEEEEEEKEQELVQTKQAADQAPLVSEELESSINAIRSGGQTLSRATRDYFEPRFGGVDFSSVRIHTDNRAAESAQSVNARAYTVGKDIVFNNGEYAPEKREGKRLLAHELTHVIQQNGKEL